MRNRIPHSNRVAGLVVVATGREVVLVSTMGDPSWRALQRLQGYWPVVAMIIMAVRSARHLVGTRAARPGDRPQLQDGRM